MDTGFHFRLMQQKTASSEMLETVINFFTIAVPLKLTCVRPPSKVHSELKSLQQSHHLLLSANSFKTYFSSSSVFAFDELYSSLPYFICQEDFYFLSHILILSLIHPEENFYFSSVTTSSPSSSNCFVSAGVGASVIRQDASLIFGNAITSRILSCFAISITRRSSP